MQSSCPSGGPRGPLAPSGGLWGCQDWDVPLALVQDGTPSRRLAACLLSLPQGTLEWAGPHIPPRPAAYPVTSPSCSRPTPHNSVTGKCCAAPLSWLSPLSPCPPAPLHSPPPTGSMTYQDVGAQATPSTCATALPRHNALTSWEFFSSQNVPRASMPRGLCTGCSFCLESLPWAGGTAPLRLQRLPSGETPPAPRPGTHTRWVRSGKYHQPVSSLFACGLVARRSLPVFCANPDRPVLGGISLLAIRAVSHC